MNRTEEKHVEEIMKYFPHQTSHDRIATRIAIEQELKAYAKSQERYNYLKGVRDGSADYTQQRWTDSDIRDMMDELAEMKPPKTKYNENKNS